MWGDAKISSEQWHQSWYLCPQQRTSSSIHPNNGSMLWSTHTFLLEKPRLMWRHDLWLQSSSRRHRSRFVSSPCLFVTGLSFSSILSRLDLQCSISRWCALGFCVWRVKPRALWSVFLDFSLGSCVKTMGGKNAVFLDLACRRSSRSQNKRMSTTWLMAIRFHQITHGVNIYMCICLE